MRTVFLLACVACNSPQEQRAIDPIRPSVGARIDWSVDIEGGAEGAGLGRALAGAGDVNGDGFEDAIVGAPGQNEGGTVWVAYGSSEGPVGFRWSHAPADADQRFGSSVAGAGDLNGDGYSDIVVGAPHYSVNKADSGTAYAFYGSSTGLGSKRNWQVSGQAGDLFGATVAGLGDVDGDGFSDIAVGSPEAGIGGAVQYFEGGPTGLVLNADWSFSATEADVGLGATLSGVGDINGDGHADMVVGVPNDDDGRGRIHVFYGTETGLASTPGTTIVGIAENVGFGTYLAGLGDVNGDGFSDLAVGSPKYIHDEPNEGLVEVFLGSDTGLDANVVWRGRGVYGSGGCGR